MSLVISHQQDYHQDGVVDISGIPDTTYQLHRWHAKGAQNGCHVRVAKIGEIFKLFSNCDFQELAMLDCIRITRV